MRSLAVIFAIAGIIFCSSCGESYEYVGTHTVPVDKAHQREDTIMYDSIAKFYFSRLRVPNTMGILGNFKIPEKNIDAPLWVVIEGRFRTNYPQSFGTITVMGSNDAKETLSWSSCYLRFHTTKLNEWCHFKDSIFLTSQLNFKMYNNINTFAFLGPSPGEKFDIDSFKVTIRQIVSMI
jgi:hypothetical protein